MVSLSAFLMIIYFPFIYLAITMLLCTVWVIRDWYKLKPKNQTDAYQSIHFYEGVERQ